MSAAMGITDDEIVAAAGEWNGSAMTYFIKNVLRSKMNNRHSLKTSYILRRLKKLEKQGRVERVKSPYTIQICWKPVKEKS